MRVFHHTITGLMTVVAVLLFVQLLSKEERVTALEKEVAELTEKAGKSSDPQTSRELAHLIDELRVPSEALFYDSQALFEIAQIRKKYYEKHGTKSFLPYHVLARAGRGRFPISGLSNQTEASASNPMSIVNGSFEHYWMNHPYAVCERLLGEIDAGTGVGGYLKKNPTVYQEKVRPLLVRILKSYHPWPSRAACRVLLALGDRSAELRQTLVHLASDQSGLEYLERMKIQELLKEFDLGSTH